MIDMIINMNGAKAPETPSPVLQEKTVTPETLPTVIGPDEGYDGLTQVTVNPDAQLKAENIRSGKTVFGVEGSFVGETVNVPAAYGSIRPFTFPYETLYTQVSPDPGLDLPAKTTYSGVWTYASKVSTIFDYELRRVVAPNYIEQATGSFMDYYVVEYDARTIKLNSGFNMNLPLKYNTILASSKKKKVNMLLYAQLEATIYGNTIPSSIVHPIKTIEAETDVSTSSTKDYLYINPPNIDVDIPAGKIGISASMLSKYVSHNSAKLFWRFHVMVTDLDFSDLYE